MTTTAHSNLDIDQPTIQLRLMKFQSLLKGIAMSELQECTPF
jgi:hypothetical protein